jgi:nicotinate-nucleotide adenylyltransferase
LKIAIFGGTFDPIHAAHIQIAQEAAEAFRLDRVLIIPAANPPHKSGAQVASYEDRYQMVEIACEGDALLEPSRLEAGAAKSYSIDTILRLKQQLSPADRLYFIIGSDAFAEITTWHRWEEVISHVEFIVVSRPGHSYAVPEGARVHRLESLALVVSSSAIRRELAAGGAPPEIPAGVLSYIRQHGLYT